MPNKASEVKGMLSLFFYVSLVLCYFAIFSSITLSMVLPKLSVPNQGKQMTNKWVLSGTHEAERYTYQGCSGGLYPTHLCCPEPQLSLQLSPSLLFLSTCHFIRGMLECSETKDRGMKGRIKGKRWSLWVLTGLLSMPTPFHEPRQIRASQKGHKAPPPWLPCVIPHQSPLLLGLKPVTNPYSYSRHTARLITAVTFKKNVCLGVLVIFSWMETEAESWAQIKDGSVSFLSLGMTRDGQNRFEKREMSQTLFWLVHSLVKHFMCIFLFLCM